MAMWAVQEIERLPFFPEGVAVSKTRRCASSRPGAPSRPIVAAGEELGLLDLGLGAAQVLEEAEAGEAVGGLGQAEGLEGLAPEDVGGEAALEGDRVLERRLDLGEGGLGQALGREARVVRALRARP